MFKRKQQDVSDSSKHWYQDKYQHVLTQRNLLALIALVSLAVAAIAVMAVLNLAPLKTVEPFLLQFDEKTGITQRVTPVTRAQFTANEAIDRYFATFYLRAREGYNPSIYRYNFNVVRLMSTPTVFRGYRDQVDAKIEGSIANRLGAEGMREIKIRSAAYIKNPPSKTGEVEVTAAKNLQVRLFIKEEAPNQATIEKAWVATITFEYADLTLNEEDRFINPLGFTVTNYQIEPETE
jgi:type IV secretion system protein VirB8